MQLVRGYRTRKSKSQHLNSVLVNSLMGSFNQYPGLPQGPKIDLFLQQGKIGKKSHAELNL